ncbi:MAG: ABC transporter permease [Actinobacteria bacterium]|nr:ABC transporter permease [Actinomycetota bacterium]MCL5070342.1 ABC transporter permease [Actinomycetota bacterium]
MKKINKALFTNFLKNNYVILLLIAVVAIFTILSKGRFLSEPSIRNILRVSVPTLVIAAMATLLMVSGNIDLSVGAALGISAVTFAILRQSGMNFFLALLIVLALGCAIGAVNGFLVMKLRITSVIATLATMSLFYGFGKFMVPDGVDMIKYDMPENMNFFAKGDFFLKLPPSFFVAIVLIIIIILFEKKTTLGKYTIAIGDNRLAAELSGINAVRTVTIIYIAVGAMAALAGATRSSYMKAGDPASGIGIEVDAIIAILLGGTSFFGGEGSVIKTVAGVYILVCITSGLAMVGSEPYWSILVRGLVFFLALIFENFVKRIKSAVSF